MNASSSISSLKEFALGWIPPKGERRPGFSLRAVASLLFVTMSSAFFGVYLKIDPPLLTGVALFCLQLLALRASFLRTWERRDLFVLAVPSLLMAISIVLGFHIVFENGSLGILTQNYLRPLKPPDLFACCFMGAGLTLLAAGLWCGILALRTKLKPRSLTAEGLDKRPIIALTLVIFAFWVPYLVTYYPGIIFPDSVDSLWQALGWRPFNNHHPVFYTLYLRLCFFLTSTFGGDQQSGVLLYTTSQMLLLAWSTAYLSVWTKTRCRWRMWVLPVMGAAFGLSRYWGSFSVCMWKDPLFSAVWCVLSCMLADFAIGGGAPARSRRWVAMFAVLGLAGVFLRNNGSYVMGAVALFVGCLWWRSRKTEQAQEYRFVAALSAGLTALALVVTGPVYRAVGVQLELVEGLGIPLNQMARVAAYNGRMSDEDRIYMNMLLPYDYYFGTYRPCCVDLLKWSRDFHAVMLERDFFSHWLSMLVKNPRLYAEGWVMQTHGFWTVNCPHINSFDTNVSQGSPYNGIQTEPHSLQGSDIWFANLWGKTGMAEVFSMYDTSVPIGWVLWAMAYLVAFFVLGGRKAWSLALIPSFGVVGTLLVATPIWYWPRYAALLQMLIPMLVGFVWLLASERRD